jgi:hypothetical protein
VDRAAGHLPADPFSIVNRELSDAEIDRRLAHDHIPTDLPQVAVAEAVVEPSLSRSGRACDHDP